MDREQAKMIIMDRMGWSETQYNEREQWARDNCLCPDCPTFLIEEQETAFCWASIGQSEMIIEENDCICGQCPVFNQSEFRTAYYCTRGSEMDQIDELIQLGGEESVA